MAEARLCAYCRQRPEEPRWRPFCSERCKMADLGRWFAGDYRVPGTQAPPGGDAEASRNDDPSD